MAACALLLAVAPAAAQVLPGGVEAVQLIKGWAQQDGTRMAAIEIRLQPGWHTYWRVPGDAGIPPRIDWSASGNLASVSYRWPRPEVFERYGLTSYGHAGALVLPVQLTPKQPGAPIEARAALEFGVCEDICAPAAASLSASIAPGDAAAGRAVIAAALASAPLSAAEAGVTAADCTLASGPRGPALHADITFGSPPPPLTSAVFEAAGQPVGRGDSAVQGRDIRVEAPLSAGAALDRSRLRLTLIGAGTAVEIFGCQPAG